MKYFRDGQTLAL